MPEPDLIQRRRELLRTFRQATARRAEQDVLWRQVACGTISCMTNFLITLR